MRLSGIQRLVGLAVLLPPCLALPQSVGSAKATFKVEVISNLIVMPGYVNGSRKLDVALDSGASDNVLQPERGAELGLKSMASVTAAGIGKGQDETAHLSSGVRLAWGPDKALRLDDQQIATLPIAYISQQTGHPVDALFGSSVFQHFRIHVDYENQEVTFAHGAPSSATGAPITIRLYGGVPFVEATLETTAGQKVPALFLVDSGTTGTMILSRTFLDAHPSVAAGHAFVNAPSVAAVGGTVDFQLLRITGLELGPFQLAAPVAAVPHSALGALADGNIAGFIGAGALSRFTVDWDYEHKTMTLTPNHRYAEPFEADASGLRFAAEKPDWKTIRIAAVSPGAPAAEAGLASGDVLQAINGKAPPLLYELTKLLAHPGASITMTIVRAGQQKTVTIHLRRLV